MFFRAPLDWLNFFLADVRGGLGAYVGVFLLTQAHWNQATLGAVLTVSGLDRKSTRLNSSHRT